MKNTIDLSAKKIGAGLLIAAALLSLGPVANAAGVKSSTGANSSAGVTPNTPYVSEQAEQTITEDFPAARNLTWGSDAGAVYTAYFTQSGTRKVANVGDDGDLLSVLTYYTPGRIPTRVRNLLTEKYPDKTIKTVEAYEQEDGGLPDISYQATLEDASHWYIVTIDGKSVQTTQVLDKE